MPRHQPVQELTPYPTCNERHTLGGGGCVAYGVEQHVCGYKVVGLTHDTAAGRVHQSDDLVQREMHATAGDRLHLIQRSTRVTQAPTRYLRNLNIYMSGVFVNVFSESEFLHNILIIGTI